MLFVFLFPATFLGLFCFAIFSSLITFLFLVPVSTFLAISYLVFSVSGLLPAIVFANCQLVIFALIISNLILPFSTYLSNWLYSLETQSLVLVSLLLKLPVIFVVVSFSPITALALGIVVVIAHAKLAFRIADFVVITISVNVVSLFIFFVRLLSANFDSQLLFLFTLLRH